MGSSADSVEVELVVVLPASEDQEGIAQSRCLRLTGWIYTYLYTNATQKRNAITRLALQLGNKVECIVNIITQ